MILAGLGARLWATPVCLPMMIRVARPGWQLRSMPRIGPIPDGSFGRPEWASAVDRPGNRRFGFLRREWELLLPIDGDRLRALQRLTQEWRCAPFIQMAKG